MKIQVLIISVFIIVFSIGLNAQSKNIKKHEYIQVTKFDTTRDAQKDLKDAVAEAKRANKKVYVDVGGEWCIWCRRLDGFYQSNPDLQEYLNKHYVFVKINYSKENKNEAVLSKFPKIDGYPHIFILDKKGKLVKSKDTGELEEGKGYSHDKVMSFLKEFAG
ncbi:MAG: thioredoxin family protein [Ignavibacteriaceae bacterium]|nr:thioredoxin family protein [Ignavibacteriaceae bacterium]